MPSLLTPQEIEDRARLAGLSLAEVCRRANVAQSTFTRWKAGLSEPRLAVYRRLLVATERRRPTKPEVA